MAEACQILLFRETDVADALHQIRLINPQFTLTGYTDGDWFCRSGEWYWTGGTGYAQYTDDGIHHQPLYQYFPNPILSSLYYTVTFTVTGMTQGSLDVYMGGDRIITVTGNGVYEVSYWSSSANTLADRILFQPSNLGLGIYGVSFFNGRVDNVSILQDRRLSPPHKETQLEPYGYLDMLETEGLGISWQVNDVRSLNKRFGAWSKTFKIPGSGNNRILLGALHSNEAQPRIYDPRNKTKAVLLADKVPVLRGYMCLKNITQVGDDLFYEIELLDNSFGLFNAIRGLKLSDLDLSSYSHTLTKNNIIASWQNSWDWRKGYSYPCYLKLTEPYDVADFTPAWYTRALLDKVITDAKFTYDLSPDLESVFNNLLTAPVGPHPKANTNDLERQGARVTSNVNQSWNTTYDYVFNGSLAGADVSAQWQANVEIQDDGSNYLPNTNLWIYIVPYTGSFDLELHIDGRVQCHIPDQLGLTISQYYSDNPYVRFEVYDWDSNATLWSTPHWNFPASLGGTGVTENRIFSGTVSLDLVAGHKIAVRGHIREQVLYQRLNNVQDEFNYRPDVHLTMIDANSFFSIRPGAGYVVGENMQVNPSEWMPKMGQDQFISDLIKAFNLYLVADTDNERRVHIFSRNELYSTTYTIDLSGKIAMNQEIIKESLTEVASSLIRLGYKEPDDEFNQFYIDQVHRQYGDRDFFFNTNIYDSESEIRLAGYTPCPITRDVANRYVPAVPVQPEEADCKLLYRSPDTYPTELRIRWYPPGSDTYYQALNTWYRPTLHTDKLTGATLDLNFGNVDLGLTNIDLNLSSNNLFEKHYSDQLAQYRDSRLFTVFAKLSNRDVLEMVSNIGARIFVQELGNWFILYAIVDFNPVTGEHQLTKLQLLESGPSEKRIGKQHIYTVAPGVKEANPITSGGITNGGTYSEATGTKVSVFNNNTGPNVTKGYFNNVYGSGNTVYDNSRYNYISGDGNVVWGGVTGTTILGGYNITATTSNATYFGNYGLLTPSGATFFSNSATTGVVLGPLESSYYGPSGVTINHTGMTIGVDILSAVTVNGVTYTGENFTSGGINITQTQIQIGGTYLSGTTYVSPLVIGNTGITIGNTYITESGLTVNGVTLAPTYVQPGTNITTGGTPSRPVVSVVSSPSFTSVSATTFYSGSTNVSHLISGRFNHPYRGIGSDYAIDGAADCVVGCNVKAAPITVTLPKATSTANWYYIIKDVSGFAATNNVTVAAQSPDLILNLTTGSTSVILSANGASITVHNNGTNWLVTSKVG